MKPHVQSGLRLRADVPVDAPGGVRLATDVYRPALEGRWPVVLLRTYLDKARHRGEAMGWARHGFACVVQDVRGRYGSEGEWRPYRHEREDGRATVDWIVARSWCDGRVAAVGGSYAAYTAWSAAVEHEAVRAVISAVPAMRLMPLQPEEGGVLPLLSRVAWWLTHSGTRRARDGAVEALLEDRPEVLRHLPLARLPERLPAELPGWREAIEETESSSGRASITDAELAALDTAALHVGGWHDPFCSETLRHLELVGSEPRPRPPRALVLGPWTHHLRGHEPARFGARDYGTSSRFPLGRFQADWLRRALDERPFGEERLRFFLGGENRWLEAPGWSSEPLAVERFHAGDAGLSSRPVARDGRASFLYDPLDPHPCRRSPLDERDLGERTDLVAFTSAPLRAPLRVLGAPKVVLWASTDAPATDWVARLIEVMPDGCRLYLSHGLVDARRTLEERGEHLEPGVPQRVDVRLAPFGLSLAAGHRLRLEITSSAFPSYARNPATGESRLTGSRTRTARQTVHWGPRRATILELPIHVEPTADLPSAGLNDQASYQGELHDYPRL